MSRRVSWDHVERMTDEGLAKLAETPTKSRQLTQTQNIALTKEKKIYFSCGVVDDENYLLYSLFS